METTKAPPKTTDALPDVSTNGAKPNGNATGGANMLNVIRSLSSISSLSSSLSKSLPSSVSPHTENARVQIFALWTSCKPWNEFFNTKKLNRPSNATELQERLMDNLTYFSSNYIFCFIILSCTSILIHPLSFVCVISLAMLYIYMFLQKSETNIELGPIKVNSQSKVIAFILISFIMLYLTNAIGIIGSWSVFSIVMSIFHAAFRISVKEPDFESPVNSV